MAVNEQIVPRFEFRAFAQSFGGIEEEMRRAASREDVSESSETYLVARGVEDQNVKARGGKLEIKRLIQTERRLERWEPTAKEPFPVSREVVRDVILRALEVDRIELELPKYDLVDLLAVLAARLPMVISAAVSKRRFRFEIGACKAEFDELLVNGAAIRSIAVESENPEALLELIDRLGMSAYENVNYPRAIRRIVGLESMPDVEI